MVRTSRPTPWVVAVALVLAAALRVRQARLDVAPEMQGLSARYHATARHLLAGEGFVLRAEPPVPYVDRFPGYVLVMAALQWLVGTERPALSAAHGVLAATTTIFLARAGARAFRPAAGHAAAFAFASFPPAWKSDTQLLETGACGLAVAALVDGLLEFREHPGKGVAARLALWSTIAVALRPDNLVVPLAVAAVAGAVAPRGARARLAPTLLVPLLVLAPWAARNAKVADGAFVSLGLGVNLLAAIGESATHEEPLFGDRELARHEGHDSLYWPDPARRDAARVRKALRLIVERPGAYLTGGIRRVPVLLSLHVGEIWPGGPPISESIAQWRESHPGRPRYEGLLAAAASHVRDHPVRAALTLGWGPLLWLLAVPGAAALRGRRGEAAALLVLPAVGLLAHLPLHAEPRYFLPFAVPLFVLAGRTLAGRGPTAAHEVAERAESPRPPRAESA